MRELNNKKKSWWVCLFCWVKRRKNGEQWRLNRKARYGTEQSFAGDGLRFSHFRKVNESSKAVNMSIKATLHVLSIVVSSSRRSSCQERRRREKEPLFFFGLIWDSVHTL